MNQDSLYESKRLGLDESRFGNSKLLAFRLSQGLRVIRAGEQSWGFQKLMCLLGLPGEHGSVLGVPGEEQSLVCSFGGL